MKKYHKINSLFKRDTSTKRAIITPEFARPEFGYLVNNEWEFTEKLDGTNIRILWDGISPLVLGKTDAGIIPKALADGLGLDNRTGHFENDDATKLFKAAFPFEGKQGDFSVCLFCEGVGERVHPGAGKYGPPAVVLFDVAVRATNDNDHWWWLSHENIVDVGRKMLLDVAPIIGTGNIHDMASMVKDGFNSRWGDFRAEGIVARPQVPLVDRRGNRIITKLKCKDYDDLKLLREGK